MPRTVSQILSNSVIRTTRPNKLNVHRCRNISLHFCIVRPPWHCGTVCKMRMFRFSDAIGPLHELICKKTWNSSACLRNKCFFNVISKTCLQNAPLIIWWVVSIYFKPTFHHHCTWNKFPLQISIRGRWGTRRYAYRYILAISRVLSRPDTAQTFCVRQADPPSLWG